MKTFSGKWRAVAVAALAMCGAARAQDMALSMVLIDHEGWQQVAEGYQFTDAACADAEGNFYFADVGKGKSINKISPDGKVSVHIDNTPKISGLKFGPDGRIYAACQAPKQIAAFDKDGKMTVVAEGAEPNDLVVTAKGDIYYTDTGKKQVVLVDAKGNRRAVDTGINKPNGITLSPDQGTLAVSDYGGVNVWVFRIEKDGSLSAREPYMTARNAFGKEVSGGDGSTTDTAGRYYVTSDVGIQVFDPTGRMCGVIAKPQGNKAAVSVAFAGPGHHYLYAASTDKIYRRKTQATGALFFQPPAGAEAKK